MSITRPFAFSETMLQSLKLRQFRCFRSMQCGIEPGMTVFLGDNAQGKTSILEAVCVGLRLQSPRSSSLADVIQFDTEAFAVTTGLTDTELLFGYSREKRKLVVDGETMRRSGDYLAHSGLVVWMANDDLNLVRGGGDGRRRFLDFMGSQLFPAYRPALRSFERALRSRNFLLKRDARPNWRQIDAYTKVLSENAAILTRYRREVVEGLKPHAARAQQAISQRPEELIPEYEASSGPNLFETLLSLRDEEERKRSTLAGPHRDDLSLNLNGMPAAQFASEGQQRTLVLALKLGQAKLFQERTETIPVLLLDDIFGELDPGRRNALLAALPASAQKLVTTTHLDWLRDDVTPDRIYRVVAGTVSD